MRKNLSRKSFEEVTLAKFLKQENKVPVETRN